MFLTVAMTVGFHQAIMDVWTVLAISLARVNLLQVAVDAPCPAVGLPNA
jgi:hypothetical protein